MTKSIDVSNKGSQWSREEVADGKTCRSTGAVHFQNLLFGSIESTPGAVSGRIGLRFPANDAARSKRQRITG